MDLYRREDIVTGIGHMPLPLQKQYNGKWYDITSAFSCLDVNGTPLLTMILDDNWVFALCGEEHIGDFMQRVGVSGDTPKFYDKTSRVDALEGTKVYGLLRAGLAGPVFKGVLL